MPRWLGPYARRRRRLKLALCILFLCFTVAHLPLLALLVARSSGGHDYGSFVLREFVTQAPYWLMPRPQSKPCTGLLVLKTRRSGSTWLYELLNQQPHTWVMYELHTRGMQIELHRQEKLLSSALGMCYADFELSGYTLDMSGFGTNVQLPRVLQRVPPWVDGLRVVAYARSNIVKHAVAMVRDELFGQKCGHANKVERESCGEQFLGLPINSHLPQPTLLQMYLRRCIITPACY